MSITEFMKKDSYSSRASRGLIAGFLGGLAGSAAKSTVEKFLKVRKIDEKTAQIRILNKFSKKTFGTGIGTEQHGLAKHLVNVPLGGTVGAVYGYSKRDDERISLKKGAILGATTWFSTHETTLPALGAEKSPKDVPLKTQAQELFAHVVFGVTTEVIRGIINSRLKRHEDY